IVYNDGVMKNKILDMKNVFSRYSLELWIFMIGLGIWLDIESLSYEVKLPFEKLIHVLRNLTANVMNQDKLLSLAYPFKSHICSEVEDHVDLDVNDDGSKNKPTTSKQKWFSHITVSIKER
nr:hypothetical protein [Tanacetum cinerariifolium]